MRLRTIEDPAEEEAAPSPPPGDRSGLEPKGGSRLQVRLDDLADRAWKRIARLPTRVGLDLSSRRGRAWLAAAAAAGFAVGVKAYRAPLVPTCAPTRGNLVQRVVASGRVRAPATVPLSSVTTALVTRVLVASGDRVASGQPLVQFDDSLEAAAVEQARAAVSQAAARLEQVRTIGSQVASEALRQAELRLEEAETEARRAESLGNAGGLSPADLERARTRSDQARSQFRSASAQAISAAERGTDQRAAAAGLAAARAALAAAEAALSRARIVAPASGLIIERHVEPGEVVQAARPLLVLTLDGAMELSIQPDERSLAVLQVGQPASAVADAFPGGSFAARVAHIAPSVDPERATVEVRLELPSPPPYLRPDMTVSVNIDVATRKDAIVVSADAVRDASRRPWVLAVRNGRAVRQEVDVGARGEDLVEILSGLAVGEPVVLPAAGQISPGRRVRAGPASDAGGTGGL